MCFQNIFRDVHKLANHALILSLLLSLFMKPAAQAQDRNSTSIHSKDTPFKKINKIKQSSFKHIDKNAKLIASENGNRLVVINGSLFDNTLYVDGSKINQAEGMIKRFEWGPNARHYKYHVFTQNQNRILYTDSHQSNYNSYVINSFRWSSNGQHFFYAGVTERNQHALVIDGEVVDVVDDLESVQRYREKFLITASKNGHGYLYIGTNKKGPYQQIREVKISDNGDHFLAPVRKAEQASYFLYDGKRHGPYQSGFSAQYGLSPTGKNWHGTVNGKDPGTLTLLIDGKKYTPFQNIGPIQYSPDGQRLAFIAQINGKNRLYENGEVRDQGKQISGLTYTPDSGELIYGKLDDGQMIVKGARQTTADVNRLIHITVHQTGTPWGFLAETRQKYYAVIDGVTHGPYDLSPLRLFFSRNGTHFHFRPKGSGSSEEYLVIDGRKHHYQHALEPVSSYVKEKPPHLEGWVLFSQNEDQFWYVTENRRASERGTWIYRNENKWIIADQLKNVYLTPKKTWIGFHYVQDRKQKFQIGEKSFTGKEITGITFSDNGQYYAARLQKSDQHETLIVNGQKVETADAISNPVFQENHLVVYVRKENDIYRYTLKP